MSFHKNSPPYTIGIVYCDDVGVKRYFAPNKYNRMHGISGYPVFCIALTEAFFRTDIVSDDFIKIIKLGYFLKI